MHQDKSSATRVGNAKMLEIPLGRRHTLLTYPTRIRTDDLQKMLS
jgi:hypothetical protein